MTDNAIQLTAHDQMRLHVIGLDAPKAAFRPRETSGTIVPMDFQAEKAGGTNGPVAELRAVDEHRRQQLMARSRRFRRYNVIRRFGQWAVTSYGVENLSGLYSYSIAKNRLDEPWWSIHVGSKLWVVPEDFDAALNFARTHFGITVQSYKEVTS